MIALVTGAAQGIGRAFAKELISRGNKLIIVDKNKEGLETLKSEIESIDPYLYVDSLTIDLSTHDAANKLFEWTTSKGYEIDILVNNAGIFIFRDFLKVEMEKVEEILTLHNLTLTKLCHFYGKDMAKRGKGYILNLSSFSAWTPLPGLSLYVATKSFVKNFTIAYAREVRESGIRVIAICPAGVTTDLYGLTPTLQRLGEKLGILISPKYCAKVGINALMSGRQCKVPFCINRLGIPFVQLLPPFGVRMMRKYTMRFQK